MSKNLTNPNQKERAYLVMTLATLVLGGGTIVALIYGLGALFSALPFLLIGALLITALWFLVTAVGRWRERSERDYHAAAARHIALQAAKDEETSGTDDLGR